MRFLLDTCVWSKAKDELYAHGYDTVWAGVWKTDPGDKEILEFAFNEQRILVTLDKDFGELAILNDQPHCGIIRLVNIATREQAQLCLSAAKLYENELKQGGIVTIEPHRTRVRLTSD